MLNSKKKIIIVLLIISLFIILTTKVFGTVSPTNDFYVNDYAGILSEEVKDYIISKNVELQQQTGAQIVVVTIESLDGNSIENYATELFRKFKIGDSNKNNGVLMLCSTNERLFRIEVGYGLEGRLTDGKTGRIQDEYIIPYLRNNNYNKGILNGFNIVLQEIINEYGIISINSELPERVNTESNEMPPIQKLIFFVALFVVNIAFFLKGWFKKLIFYVVYLITFISIAYFLNSISIFIYSGVFLIIAFLLDIIGLPEMYLKRRFYGGKSSGGGGFSGGVGSSGGGGSTRSF